jgi:tetratricopeptide (TPR) repeat protein
MAKGPWIVIGVALVVRLLHLAFVRANDPLYAHTLPDTDMHTYWEWAKSIAGGDWLSRNRGAFYYGPLYPYWLAPWFALFGANYDLVHGLQAVIGVVAPLATWSVARRLFGPLAGLVAGLLIALSAPILFYEQLLLMEGLLVAIHAGFLWCLLNGLTGASRRPWLYAAAAGLLGGMASLGRGNFQLVALLFVPGCYVLTRLAEGEAGTDTGKNAHHGAPAGSGDDPTLPRAPQRLRSRAWTNTLAYTAALGLVLGASLLRNGLVGGRWLLTTGNGPILLYIGNATDGLGIFSYPESFLALDAKYGGNRGAVPWTRELIASISQHPDKFFSLLVRKAWFFLNGYDVADNASFYLFARFSPLLYANPIGWELTVALGLVGAWLTRRQWRRVLYLHLYALSFAASIIAVFIVGRYRLEFLLPMAIFAGAAVAQAVEWAAARKWRPFVAACAAAVVLTVVLGPRFSPIVYWYSPPTRPEMRLIRPNDYLMLARAYGETGSADLTLRTLAEGSAAHPWDYGLAHGLARSLEEQGRLDEAIDVLRRYLSWMPHDADAAVELARLLARAGHVEQSRELLENVLAVLPGHAKARELLDGIRAAQHQ